MGYMWAYVWQSVGESKNKKRWILEVLAHRMAESCQSQAARLHFECTTVARTFILSFNGQLFKWKPVFVHSTQFLTRFHLTKHDSFDSYLNIFVVCRDFFSERTWGRKDLLILFKCSRNPEFCKDVTIICKPASALSELGLVSSLLAGWCDLSPNSSVRRHVRQYRFVNQWGGQTWLRSFIISRRVMTCP